MPGHCENGILDRWMISLKVKKPKSLEPVTAVTDAS